MIIQSSKVKLGAILLLFIAAAVLWYVYYAYFVFHINKVDPPANKFPSSQQTIRFSFNHPLAKNDKTQVTLSPAIPAEIKFSEKEIRIELSQLVAEGTKLEVRLKDIKSIKNDTYSKTVRFNVVYVPFNQLSNEQQSQEINKSDSFESDYPLIKSLPLIANDYEIDYKFPASYEKKMPIIITSKAILELDPSSGVVSDKTRNQYLIELIASRNKAIDFIKKQGYNPEKYRLVFAEPELVDQFGGTYLGAETFGG